MIDRCLAVLRGGGVILYPTDTIWGLGCDARAGSAVTRIDSIKGRAGGRAYLSLVGEVSTLEGYVGRLPVGLLSFLSVSERPVSVVYDLQGGVDLSSSDGTYCFRLPRDRFSLTLARCFGGPIVSTSANASGAAYADIGAGGVDAQRLAHVVDYAVPFEYGRSCGTVSSAIYRYEGGWGRLSLLRG